MEVISAPTGNGAKQWLSELGLEEPSLVRHLDSLFPPSSNHLHSSLKGFQQYNSYDLNGSVLNQKQRDSLSTMNNSFSSGYPYSQWDALLNPERPSKIPKLNSWDCTILNEVPTSSINHPTSSINHPPLMPLIFNHNKEHQRQHQSQIQHHQQNHVNHYYSTQQQQQQQQLARQSMEGFVASLPKLSDDMHDSVAPRTPTMEMGGSQVLGAGALDNCTSDAMSHEVLSSNCNRESPSMAESFRGKRKSEFFPSPTDMRIQRPAAPMVPTRAPSPPSKGSGHTQDHIMAERKRREKLSQRFIALSAIVPGLKKMDKASVLGDAIKYLKSLQDKVQKLEEQAPKKNVCSIAVVKSSKDSKGSGSDGEAGSDSEVVQNVDSPDIEARVNDKNVLIKMHAEMKIGSVAKCISELEKLHLIVMNANILSFTNTSVDLTMTAQTEDGYEITADEIVASLQSFFKTSL